MNQYCSLFIQKYFGRVAYPLMNLIEGFRFDHARKQFADVDLSNSIRIKNVAEKSRCFIVASGPSLTAEDLDKISNEDSIAVNSCYKIFDKTKWRPKYYCVTDDDAWNNVKDGISQHVKCPLFYSFRCIQTDMKNSYGLLSKICYPLYPYARLKTKEDCFSMDASKYVYEGQTVVYVAIQLAVTLGYKEIYLIGTDCDYSGARKYNADMGYSNQQKVPGNIGDASIRGYDYAEQFSRKHGFRVYNATRGGKLESFERVVLEDVLSRE